MEWHGTHPPQTQTFPAPQRLVSSTELSLLFALLTCRPQANRWSLRVENGPAVTTIGWEFNSKCKETLTLKMLQMKPYHTQLSQH